MNTYQNPLTLPRAFIVDDDCHTADDLIYKLENLNYNPELVPERDIYELSAAAAYLLARQPAAVICDHRLTDSGFQYDGATLAAQLVANDIPALLVTQYLDQDVHVSIRRHRKYLPVVLARDTVSTAVLSQGLDKVRREISGDVEASRRPHRVMVEIAAVDRQSDEKVIDVIIDSWNPKHAVRLPVSLVPKQFRNMLRKGALLYAEVNIGAPSSDEIYIDNIEWAGFLDEGDE